MAKQVMQHRTPAAPAPASPAGPAVAGPRARQLAAAAAALGGATAQRATDEELLQGANLEKKKQALQAAGLKKKPVQKAALEEEKPVQRAANRTGLPDALKSGVESLSGMSMDHVRVHHNSAKPAQLGAHAYAQGSDIHLAPGQAHHLPHEAWHVVQQAQGRVKPTMQLKEGVPVNDDAGLEREADIMGAKAAGGAAPAIRLAVSAPATGAAAGQRQAIQRKVSLDLEAAPNPNGIVHIIGITRPTTPLTSDLSGEDSNNPAARHIIPWALSEREFKGRYSGRTVQALSQTFNVAIDDDFMINVAAAMQRAVTYENRQLNRGGGGGNRPPGATADAARHLLMEPTVHPNDIVHETGNNPGNQRNYWEGDSTANLNKDIAAGRALKAVERIWEQGMATRQPLTVARNDVRLTQYRNAHANAIIAALAEEFDPPPFASKAQIHRAAQEWARMTNSWLANDEIAWRYYWPGRNLVAADAYSAGANQIIYNNAR